MCGIIGWIGARDLALDAVGARDRLRHRGPDDAGLMWWSPGRPATAEGPGRLALGHRRLSILDLSPLGHQPMSTPDGRWHIVFNGEVYNFIELRAELAGAGHVFRSHSDTEVVLTALATWGAEAALARFRGMFAFAALDTLEQRVVLARDPFGIKPLFLCRWRDGIAFASETAPLLELPGVDRSLDAERCWHYLRYGVTDHGDRSMLRGIRQIPPAHWSTAMIDRAEELFMARPYWDPTRITPCDLPFAQAAERFRALFLDSVRVHLRSDVPVGTALSGGLDSSSIVCAIRHLEPKQEMHTFSYIPDEARISEAGWIDLVNNHVGAIAHPVRPSADDLAADLDRLMRAQGEPFGSTSIYAQFAVFRAASQAGITVMLDGQGADEMLAGYDWYQGARLASLATSGRWWTAIRLLRAQRAWAGRRPLRIAAYAGNYLLPAWILPTARTLFGRTDQPRWADLAWFRKRGVPRDYPFQPPRHGDRLRQALCADVSGRGLIQLLRYEDRNSMAWSIESRVPFLHTDLVEFALSLPESYLVGDDGTSKRILRAALRGIVPDAILDRRDKIGFATPEATWLRRRPDLAAGTAAAAASIPGLIPTGVMTTIDDALSGRRPFDFQVWRLVNFVEWYRRHTPAEVG